MAMTVRLFATQAIKGHIPQIKFPQRSATNVLAWPPPSSSTAAVVSSVTPSSSTPPPTPPLIGSTSRGSGIEFNLLPERYRRSVISEEEMAVINNGGPL